MDVEETKHKIVRIIRDALDSRGQNPPEITGDTVLLGGELPIDSLDLAVIVVEMDELTGKEPFRDGFINFRTVGELARLYAD